MSQQPLCHSIKQNCEIISLPEDLERKINFVTEHQRRYIRSIFLTMAQVNPTNAAILYDYLAAQQNELNIKESTKESTIKRIIWLSRYLNHKTFNEITKDDILAYLNSRIKIQIINGWALTTEHKWYFLHSSGGFTMRMNMIPKDDYSAVHEGHKEYEVKRIDDIEYRYDKFDKILIPYRETMTLYANSMKGAPIYWIRPKEPSIAKYINSRIQEIETTIDNKYSSKYQSVDTSEDFLRQLIDRYTAKFVILSMDLKGSTRMSLDLSPQVNALITKIFSKEIAKIVGNYHGHILKYMGDGILAYFPIPTFWGMDDNALDCAVTMKSMVEKGINPIFKRRNIPRLKFRIGIDSGDALVTDIGDISAKLHKDLIGATISLTTKIQSCAEENQIVIGHTMLANLGVHRRSLFQEYEPLGWDYSLPMRYDFIVH